MSGPLVRELAESLESGFPATGSLMLDLGGPIILVRSNSRPLIEALTEYFTGFIAKKDVRADVVVTAYERPELDLPINYTEKPPDPGKTRIKEEYVDLADGRVVRKRLTGMVFAFNEGRHIAVGPCLANSNQVVNFINSRLIQSDLDRGALLAHAAGVTREGRGLALAGFSGLGKSTLALHLMSRGLNFVSNDRLLFFCEGPSMRGVPKLPRINPGTALGNPDLSAVLPEDERNGFASLGRDEIWDIEHKYDVKIADLFGEGRFELHSPLNALVILNWRRNEDPIDVHRVDLAQKRDLLRAVMKSPGLFYRAGPVEPDHSESIYIKCLEKTAVFEIGGGVDFTKGAEACLEILSAS